MFKKKAPEVGTNPKYDGYQRALAIMVWKCFDKKTTSGAKASANMES